MTDTALLQTVDLNIAIGHTTVARQFDFTLEPGQCWCILGRNGAGKTTLLHTLAGLRRPESGIVRLNGARLDTLPRKHIARQLGILFQNQEDSFPASVMETVLQGRHPHLSRWQWESETDRDIARQALDKLGMAAFAERDVLTLSGGERQRVAIATLLAQQSRLLFLDEPTNHLDLHHRIEVLQLLRNHCRESGAALLMVLHDINLAARFCDHAVLMHGAAKIDHGGCDEILQTTTLEALFQHPLTALETPHGRAWLPL